MAEKGRVGRAEFVAALPEITAKVTAAARGTLFSDLHGVVPDVVQDTILGLWEKIDRGYDNRDHLMGGKT